MRLLAACFLYVFLTLNPALATAQNRIALVIGMSEYATVVELTNTISDARGISNTLTKIGFQVTTLENSSGADLRAALDDFAFRSETADLALIYFAGHGVEVQGENYLIPVDANVKSNRDVQRQAVSLKEMLAAVDGARTMRIVILDSCRDNPFGDELNTAQLNETTAALAQTRSAGGGGLAAPSPDRGTLVSFAARDGERALDGIGNNSPFALALMGNLTKPGLEISLMFRQVRDQVLSETGNLQEPHTYGSLSGTPFYIAGSAGEESLVQNADLRLAWSDIRPEHESQLASLASQGDTRSMIGLAYIRLNSNDKRYAPVKAAELLTTASEAGSPEAQFELAQLYEIGLGVAQDVPRAMELYHQAAAQDYPDALNDLGFIYYQGGQGIPADKAKALEYFQRAADLRQPQAMFNVAALIDDGVLPGKGPDDAARYLYQSLRTGSEQVYEILRDRPSMFKTETRKALQVKLAEFNFYSGAIDGDFGSGTQRGIRAAYGLSE